MSPVAIRDDEMGGRPSAMARAYGEAWTGTGFVGTLPPEAREDPQHLAQVVHGVDVELGGGLGLGRLELDGRDEEDRGARPLDRDRLLGHTPHVTDVAVRVDRARWRRRSGCP